MLKSKHRGRFYYHGDVMQLTDEAGNLVRAYDYDAFGNQRALAGNSDADGNAFRYCGEYLDLSSGTYYLKDRYYDLTIGRFLAEDTHWNHTEVKTFDDFKIKKRRWKYG